MSEVKQIGNYRQGGTWDNPQTGRVYSADGISPTLNTCNGGDRQPKIVEIGKINNARHSSLANSVLNTKGICPTIDAMGGGNREPKILEPTIKIKQATKDGYIECKLGGVADLSYPTSKTRRGRVQDNGDTCPTLTASETGICRIETPYRIRKLTPLECWRLMDFTDEDFYKAKYVIEIEEKQDFIEQAQEKVNKILNSSLPESKKLHHIKNLSVKIRERTSNTQLYKQAGNSIVKAVLMAIFKQMM